MHAQPLEEWPDEPKPPRLELPDELPERDEDDPDERPGPVLPPHDEDERELPWSGPWK
jgi:hypothetical protein